MYVNYVVGDWWSKALLRRSARGHIGFGIIAQESGIILLVAGGAFQAVAHDFLSLSLSFSLFLCLSLSLSLVASCQLCKSLTRRIRTSIPDSALSFRASDYRLPWRHGDDGDSATAIFDAHSTTVLLAISPVSPLVAARQHSPMICREKQHG